VTTLLNPPRQRGADLPAWNGNCFSRRTLLPDISRGRLPPRGRHSPSQPVVTGASRPGEAAIVVRKTAAGGALKPQGYQLRSFDNQGAPGVEITGHDEQRFAII
jgi:hypothetical protein